MREPQFKVVQSLWSWYSSVLQYQFRSFYNLIFLVFVPLFLFGQNPHQPTSINIDQKVIQLTQAETQNNDTLALALASEIGMNMLIKNELDSALYYFEKSIELAKQNRALVKLKELTDAKARVLISKGDFTNAILVIKQLSIYEDQLNNLQGKAELYAQLAGIFRLIGKFDSCNYFLQLAIETAPNPSSNFIKGHQAKLYRDIGAYDKAFSLQMDILKTYEKEEQEIAVFNNLIELSQILLEQQQLDKAEEFAERALALAIKLELKIYKGRVHKLLGNIALQQQLYTKAQLNFEEALLLFQRAKRPLEQADIYLALGKLEQKERKLEVAEQYFEQANQIYQSAKEQRELVNVTFAIANLYLEKEETTKALQGLNSILSFVENMGDKQNTKTLYRLLAKTYHQIGNTRLGYAYMEKYDQVKDELYNLERIRTNNELEIKYQLREKEQSIRELKQDAQLNETQLRLQNFYIIALILGAVAMLGLALVFYRNWQKNKLISNQKAALDTIKINQLEQEKRLIALQSLIEGQEQERQRIASDLHDGLGALLSTVRLQFDSIKMKHLPDTQQKQFQKSKELLAIASREAREIAHNMMPGSIRKFGLLAAIQDMCNAITYAQGIQVDFQSFHFEETQLPDKQIIAIFRIIQELLNNIIKHAQATEVLVQITQQEEQLEIIVEDNGQGFNIDETETARGMGLTSVQSRVDYLQGKMEVESTLGQGSTFTILIP